MAAFRLVLFFLFTFYVGEITVYAQRNVWRDDKEAVLKADTSLVKIEDSYFQKVITVTYKEVTPTNFDDELERLRGQISDLRTRFDSDRERFLGEVEQLNLKIDAESNFMRAAKKEMRWLDREERLSQNPKKNEVDIQAERRDFFKSKTKNEKN